MKKNNKINKYIFKISIVVILIALLYLFLTPYKTKFSQKKENENEENSIVQEYFDFGNISDSVYCNNFFKFKISIPKGFEGAYKKYDYVNKSLLERDSIPIISRLAKDVENCNLLILEPELIEIDFFQNFIETGTSEAWRNYSSKKSKRDLNGPDCQIAIRAHNLSGNPLGAYTSKFENLHNPDYGDIQTKKISGVLFNEYHGIESQGDVPQKTFFMLMGGENKKIISYNTKINSFAFSIDLFYTTEKQKKLLLEIVDNISFF
ncbi:hypothetical protein CLV91_2223 [Maribacter vaceletii]|uniref:Uncharacterized protein n=1 Tax=Maribacter vaceletii TaxID=1206816 RepID=A0A495EAF7_9FLAO|nr:hypothetical protein [Maribacter vaceletii]RKR13503.1 hypothetical protein CLV91_2223 [Maribacter vaceletii]